MAPLPLRFRCARTLLFAALVVAGCGDGKKLSLGGSCSLNSDCADSLSCKFGKCHRTCVKSRDCARDERCVQVEGAGVCQFVEERSCGSGCAMPLVCGSDLSCRSSCERGERCLEDQICMGGKVCVEQSEPASADGGAADVAPGGTDAAGVDTRAGEDAPASDTRPAVDGPPALPDVPPAMCSEPDETPEQACTLPLQTVVEGRLTTPADIKDHYRFTVEKGVVYTLNFWNTTPVRSGIVFNATLRVEGGGSTVLLGDTGVNGDYQPVSVYPELKPLSNGTVIIAVSSASATYKLSVVPSVGLVQNGNFEPNNSISSAAPIELNKQIAAALSSPEDLQDHYAFPVEANVVYTLNFWDTAPVRTGMVLRGWLVMGTGEPMRLLTDVGVSGDYQPTVNFTELKPTMAGTAVLQVSGGNASYRFRISPSVGLQQDASHEPNNTPSNAAPLMLGQEILSAIDNVDDPWDYFSFAAEANVPYLLTVTNLTPGTAVGVEAKLDSFMLLPRADLGAQPMMRTLMSATAGTVRISVDRPSLPLMYRLKVTRQ